MDDLPRKQTVTLKAESFPHQQQVYELSRDRKFFALFMEQGTGKTKVIIDTASHLFFTGQIDAVVILAPNGIQENWHYRELPKFCSVDYTSHFRASYHELYDKYDELMAPRSDLLFLAANIEWVLNKKGWLFLNHFLLKHRVLLVIDESTLIKNHSAQRTKRVLELGSRAAYRRIMTGTPSPQGPVDLYAQMKFLSPTILPYGSFYAFQGEFCVMKQRTLQTGRSFLQLEGFKNLSLLSKLIEPHCYRVLKKDCLQLPEKVYKTLYTCFDPKQQKMYESMRDELKAELENQTVTVANVTSALIKLQQLMSGFIVDETGTPQRTPTRRYSDAILYFFPKEPEDSDCSRDSEGKPKKTIIFFRFKYEIEIFKAALRALGSATQPYEYVEYTGDISSKDRNEAVDNFQSNSKIMIFLATSAAARGLTLTAAKRVIYFSQDYNLETRLQSEDRAHRIGQTDDVEYWNIVLPETVDQKIIAALEKKQNISNEISKNWRQFFE